MFSFLCCTFIVPFLILLIVFLMRKYYSIPMTAGSDLLAFFVAFDFGLLLNCGEVERIINSSHRAVVGKVAPIIDNDWMALFVLLTVTGIAVLVFTLMTEKAMYQHIGPMDAKLFFQRLLAAILVLFSTTSNIFVILLPVF